MTIDADGYRFDFSDAVTAFVFDETDPGQPTFHGAPMKAVDLVVELTDAYLFVEVKDYQDPDEFDVQLAKDDEDKKHRRQTYKWLKNYLKYKYRDSYLYRHAEEKCDKPIHYLVLINLENALNTALGKALRSELPVGKKSKRWTRELAKSCQVVDVARWNKNFPKWPVAKIAAAGAAP